jgi:hypothetical protein
MKTLVLVVTRRCTQRCTYCPVVKDDWQDMPLVTARQALRVFAEQFGGGYVKLFGGEPMLSPGVVRAVCEDAAREATIARLTLYTNGALLEEQDLDFFAAQSKLWLTISLDGKPEDHRGSRRVLPGEPDALASIDRLLPHLLRYPRFTATQVIAPELAERAVDNFRYLLSRGVRRFNLLPASWVVWSREQLEALRAGLAGIAELVRAEWRAGRSLYLRNLFVRSPQPTFASGVVVDVDGHIFPSDCVLANLDEQARVDLCAGSVESPPSEAELQRRAARVPEVLERTWPREVLDSTRAADQVLNGFYRSLMREYLALRRPAA